MNIKKNFLLLIIGLLMTFLLPNYARAGTPTTTWNGLTIAEILTLNSTWGSENYYGLSCEIKNNVDGKVNTEWNCNRSSGGKFASHIEIEGSNYHCHITVTGSGVTGTYNVEQTFTVTGSTVQAKKDLINSKCGGVVTPTPATCPTLEALNATIPSYALSDNGNKVTICHLTSSTTNPYNVITISTNALNPHLNNHGDYFSKSGACPTDAVPCPPLVCTAPAVLNQAGDACIVPDPQTCQAPTTAGTYPNCSCPIAGQTVVNGVCTAPPTCQAPTTAGTYPNCSCPIAGQTVVNGVCQASASTIPTVISQKTSNTTPILTGSAGNTTLQTLTIELNKKDIVNSSYTNTYTTTVSATAVTITNGTWSFTHSVALQPGIYEVIATSDKGVDITHDELEITIDICDNKVDKTISITAWDSSRDIASYYLGSCVSVICTNPPTNTIPAHCTAPLPDITDATILPLSPDSLGDEVPVTVNPNEVQTCSDGSILSGSVAESVAVSIKRVRIANATTEGGTFDDHTFDFVPATKTGTKVRYGKMTKGSVILTPYEFVNDKFENVTITPVIKSGQSTGVMITGATIENVYIDLLSDYIDANGNVISASNGIAVRGGITKVNTTKENGDIKRGTITSGMITSGTDAAGNPMRGRITSGFYESDLTNNPSDVLIKGRRTKGTLKDATIMNVRTTTVNGVTIVDGAGIVKVGSVETIVKGTEDEGKYIGTIMAGAIDVSTVTPRTFGTVTNATVKGNVISNTNTCFSSGSVGSRGQLNWKEVVK